MIRDAIAVGLTGLAILLLWAYVTHARKSTLGRYDITSLVLLLLPPALMAVRRFGEERQPLTILVCAIVGSVLMLKGRRDDAE